MDYLALWQEYTRGPAALKHINFSAKSDHEALYKIFASKIAKEDYGSVEQFLKEMGMSKRDLTQEFLIDVFDNIDIGGWPFLQKLTNKTTGKVVFELEGIEPLEDDWDEDGEL